MQSNHLTSAGDAAALETHRLKLVEHGEIIWQEESGHLNLVFPLKLIPAVEEVLPLNSSLWHLTYSWFMNWQINTRTLPPATSPSCSSQPGRSSQEQVLLPGQVLALAKHFPQAGAGAGSVLADLGLPNPGCGRSWSCRQAPGSWNIFLLEVEPIATRLLFTSVTWLKRSLPKTYFSKDKMKKEHYFKFVTHSVIGVSIKLSINSGWQKIVPHLLIMETAVKYFLTK